jgi:hypothetical protein
MKRRDKCTEEQKEALTTRYKTSGTTTYITATVINVYVFPYLACTSPVALHL